MKLLEIFSESQQDSTAFNGIVFHGSDKIITAFRIDPKRGTYFSGDAEYASDYGSIIYRCRVKLRHPKVVTEDEANGDIEIDRLVLMRDGYDGRIVRYDNGEIDVIAFNSNQITILERLS